MPKALVTAFILVLTLWHGRAGAGDASTAFATGPERVTLIELYTSEGCSSCPPADRWLSRLAHRAGLWTDFIPIAFHVDYWDDLGWKDRFSQPGFSERQRRYAAEGGARVVYTPGVFRNGGEWLEWRERPIPVAEKTQPGELEVKVDGESVTVVFHATDAGATDYTAHFALLGMNLETRVEAGENRGRRLAHDFVALAVHSAPLERGASGHEAHTRLPEVPVDSGDRALAVWVSERGRQAPIQSAGGYLDGR